MNVADLYLAIGDVPMSVPVEIFAVEGDGPLRVVLDDEAVTITNDSSCPGEQLWPRP